MLAIRSRSGGCRRQGDERPDRDEQGVHDRRPSQADAQRQDALPSEEAFGTLTQHEGRFTVFVGGFPIFVDGDVGAVAASGGNGEQDIAVCEAGMAADEAFRQITIACAI